MRTEYERTQQNPESQVFEADSAQLAVRAAMQHEAKMFILAKEGKVHPETHEPIKPPCTTLDTGASPNPAQ